MTQPITNSGREEKWLDRFVVFVMAVHFCLATAIIISMVVQ